MSREHIISDEALEKILNAVSNNKVWMTYNSCSFFLDTKDVKCFPTEKEAYDYSFENNSKEEVYEVIRVKGITDLYNQIFYGKKMEQILNSKLKFMNLDNLNYLKDNLKFMGFGDKLHPDLEKNMQQGFPEFVLKMNSEFSQQKMESILHFRKSDQSDHYFFNRHDAVLRNEVGTFEQTFYLNHGKGVTLKEAFNLLEGRAVYKEIAPKEGEKYHAWVQLDLKEKEASGNHKVKQFHENYGYDLAKALQGYAIKELQNEQQRERLMMSLQKGNVQSVTIATNGKEQMFFIEANPQYKTITVYSAQMKMLSKDQREELLVKEAAQKQKINGQQIKTTEPGQKPKEEPKKETNKNTELPRSDTEKKTGKAKTQTESAVNKKEKSAKVKDLLPQKEGASNKKAMRV